MEKGWIKLDRDLTSHWIWRDVRYLKWWMDLLLMAEWREQTVRKVCGRLVTIRRGQAVASVRALCDRWQYDTGTGATVRPSPHTVMKFLTTLSEAGMIVTDNETLPHNTTLITICNYAKYQDVTDDTATDPATDTETDTATDTATEAATDPATDPATDAATEAATDPVTVPATIYKNNKNKKKKEERGGRAPAPAGDDESEFVREFNAVMDRHGADIPRLTSLGAHRAGLLRRRRAEHGPAAIGTVVEKAARSGFLNGRNPRRWRASFDWLMDEKNFPRVLEGQFDNDDGPADTAHALPAADGNHVNHLTSHTRYHYETKSPDRYSKRRGADSAAVSPQDYTDQI